VAHRALVFALAVITSVAMWASDTRGSGHSVASATTPSGSTTYTYDLADRIISGAVPPTYDDNGNITNDGSHGGRSYTYDALGRLTAVSGNGTTATYTLDGAGNRWAETVNGVTTSFDLDLSVANPTILSDGTKTYLPGDPSAGYEQAGTWWSALNDAVGSPLQFVSQTGATSTAVHYVNRTDFGGGSTPWRMEPWQAVPVPRAAARPRGSTHRS